MHQFAEQQLLGDGGISMLPSFIVGDDLASGRLIRILPDYTSMRAASLYVVYAGVPKVPAKIVAFRDFVADAFAKICVVDSPPKALPPPPTRR